MVGCLKFFIAFLLLSFLGKGLCQECSLDNLNIGQARSGRMIGGKPEWNVTVTNNCRCSRNRIVLSCRGFQTAATIDPDVFYVNPYGQCLLIKGHNLSPSDSVRFSYAWDPPFLMLPIHYNPVC